jgi:hypothetical protein
LEPLYCLNGNGIICNSWQVQATINITTTDTYSGANGFRAGTSWDSVVISPSLSLNAGDRAVVTITFTVSG